MRFCTDSEIKDRISRLENLLIKIEGLSWILPFISLSIALVVAPFLNVEIGIYFVIVYFLFLFTLLAFCVVAIINIDGKIFRLNMERRTLFAKRP